MTHSFNTPSDCTYDVLGIGNAIVDVLSQVEDAFLEREAMRKGAMQLVDRIEAETLYRKLGQCTECSGGSVANSMAAMASLGANVAFIGRVADDDLGRIFYHDMRSIGVQFNTAFANTGSPTARCMVCVTPDAQRSMSTYIGACAELASEDIDEALIADAGIVYVEGYLWDQPPAKDAIRKAFKAAKAAGRKVALSLSDVFCVERHRAEFQTLIEKDVDILFANEAEAAALYELNDPGETIERLAYRLQLAVVTRSEDGAIVSGIANSGRRVDVPAEKVADIVDSTGAGDLFAAGFLYSLSRGGSFEEATKLGHRCAAEIIQHIGARSMKPLRQLVA